jgi:vanillin dehydrogenase
MASTFASPASLPDDTGVVPDYDLFIAGAWVPARQGSTADDMNPASGGVFAHVAQADKDDATAALVAAARASSAWADMPVTDRAAILHRTAEILERRRMELVDVLIDEAGSLPGKAHYEVDYCIGRCRSVAADALYIAGETLPTTRAGQFGYTIRRPLGVVVGISPFNLPLMLGMKKVLPAIAAGNTFVLKPSEETPVIGLKIASVLDEAGLPPGVLNVIPGPAETLGDVLLTDPRVRMITFTGSTAIGRKIASTAAPHLKRVTLEMGGKNAIVVLADADFDYALETAAFSAFFHQGQICLGGSRIIVEAPLYERFAEALAMRVAGYRVGSPREKGTTIGPLIRASQCEKIANQIDDALRAGARLLTGGSYRDRYFDPTVVADVTPDMLIFGEESFGPVAALIRAEHADHALELANKSDYGLAAAVLTNDLALASRFAEKLEAGMVFINDTTLNDEPVAPFGGIKQSGVGREGGRYSMHDLTELKWVAIRTAPRRYPPVGL